MKLQKFTLTVLIFMVLFTSGMQCRDSEERRIRRNERREERKLRRSERSRRTRPRDKFVTEKDSVFHPESVEMTPVIPVFPHPKNPEDMVREGIRMQQRRARHRSRFQDQQETLVDYQQETTTTTSEEFTTTAANDNLYYDTRNVNLTWSGDQDLVSINSTLNDTILLDDYDTGFSNETTAHVTRSNMTSTAKPPRTTPDKDKVRIWRERERNKHIRMMIILREIPLRLGFKKTPNITTPLTPERRKEYENIYENLQIDEGKERGTNDEEYFAKRYFWHLPSCEVPRKSDSYWTTDGDLFRLYFDVNQKLEGETKVSQATLRLYKKSFAGCDCELISKNPSATQPRRRRHATHTERALEDEVDETDSQENKDDEDDDDEVDPNDQIQVTLYRYQKPVNKKRRDRSRIPLDTKFVTKREEGWIKFNITGTVASWLNNSKKNFGLVVIAEDMQKRVLNANLLFENYNCSVHSNQTQFPVPFPLALPGSSQSERNRTSHHLHANQTYPYLEFITKDSHTEDNAPARYRRDLTKRKTKGCVREDMYVSFAELGWSDWIIQPLGFDAGYCRGTCSTEVEDPSGPLKIKHFTSKLPDGVEFTQFECCGPSKLKPLQILHQNQHGEMTVSIFDEFIITECGCRP